MTSPHIDRINEALARYSGGDLGAVDELVAPVYANHVPADDEPTATEVVQRFAAAFKEAAPDLRVSLTEASEQADGVVEGVLVLEGSWSGGALWGVEPSGKRYEFRLPVTVRSAVDRYTFEIGLDTPDGLAILRSLGLVNPPDQMHLPGPPVELDDFLLKLLFTGQAGDKPCAHLADVQVVRTDAITCDDCAPDAIWPALRLCLSCGHVGCCDTSVEKHAKAHWETTGHPLIRSIRMDEGWIWCYDDAAVFEKRMLERIALRLGETV